MLVLGLQGSPRRKGNTAFLLDLFLSEAARLGARTRVIHPAREPIAACRGCGTCEKQGLCVNQDIMGEAFFPLLREADLVVAASPVYFYGITAQLKGFIDRCQTFWSRKYRLRLTDPGAATRSGLLLAVAASHGSQLFEGLQLTARYFFDAIAARDGGALTYRGIEHTGDMAHHPEAALETARLAASLLGPLVERHTVAFYDASSTGAAWVAAAWMRHLAGDRWDVYAAPAPADKTLKAGLGRVMAQSGIDMGYYQSQPLEQAPQPVDRVIALGATTPEEPRQTLCWPIPALDTGTDLELASFCDAIRTQVRRFIDHDENR